MALPTSRAPRAAALALVLSFSLLTCKLPGQTAFRLLTFFSLQSRQTRLSPTPLGARAKAVMFAPLDTSSPSPALPSLTEPALPAQRAHHPSSKHLPARQNPTRSVNHAPYATPISTQPMRALRHRTRSARLALLAESTFMKAATARDQPIQHARLALYAVPHNT